MAGNAAKILILLALAGAGCGPDAPRDNPYDVPQTGVYGTIYRRGGGVLGGVAVSVSPANMTTVSDAQGNYTLELPGGSHQALQFSKAEHQSETKTVDVPERGLLQQNIIMSGQIVVDTFKVKTVVIKPASGAVRYYIQPYLVAHHPDGRSYLDSFSYRCRVDTFDRASGAPVRRDDFTNVYAWEMIEARVAGYQAEFQVSSPGNAWLGYRYVPSFLEPAPGSLSFWPPDSLHWTNGLYNVRIRVEVRNSGILYWSKDTTNIENLRIAAVLAVGTYVWNVIQIDAADNRSQAEAAFTIP